MDKIKAQASTVSQVLLSAETGRIYKQALTRTWDIIRETSLLLWLVICLTFVGGEWLYRTAVKLGRNTRAWYSDLGKESAVATPGGEPQTMGSTGQALLDTVQSGTAYLLNQARQQLGIKPSEAVPPASASTSAPVPTPAPTSTAAPETKVVSAPSMPTTPAAEPSAKDDEEAS
ncbi:MAG: hypothetical protein HC922_10850 [Leptolyngbyaceae cyanobacterium SM2_3_12]|nr:hypothetical protein [Leptolyngbyaceae cyanobacterium SM2_3_12]